MPVPHTRATQAQAVYASLSSTKRGTPEHQRAAAEYYFVKALTTLQDSLSRSPVPWTDEQRAEITEILAGA